MTRLLSLDYGAKKIGVAISDPDQIVATGKGIIHNIEINKTLEELKKICFEYNIEKIIIGLPLNLQGQDTAQTLTVKKFAEKLKKYVNLPVSFQDERFTSLIIDQINRQEKKKKIRKNQNNDTQSAILILQGYLDKLNR